MPFVAAAVGQSWLRADPGNGEILVRISREGAALPSSGALTRPALLGGG